MKYQPPFDPALLDPVNGIHNADADAPYVNGDPRIGQEGSIPPAAAFEHSMREIVEVIDQAGMTPDHTDLTQLRAAVLWMIEHLVPFAKSGDGVDIYHGGEDDKYYFRSLVAGDNITLTVLTDGVTGRTSIKIDSAGSGGGASGESNTGSNLGAGAKVFKQKNVVDFEHRTLVGGADITITEGADTITISYNGSSTPNLATVAPAMMVQQKRLPSTPPIALATKVWTRRPFNELIINQITGASLNVASNQITLPAGTYRATFTGMTSNAGHHRTRLYDVTHAVALAVGHSSDSHTYAGTGVTNSTLNSSMGIGHFTLTETTVVEIQTYSIPGAAGGSAKMGDSEENGPDYHIDGWVEIVKEA